jgi:DNA-binding NtrC family response regulator
MLVVDDEPENLEMIGVALAGEHLNLVLERNAESALERVKEFRPRIVLSDLRLPGMDGFEFLDRVLAVDPGTDFMLMTGFYSPESAVDAIRRGACDYFSKPLDIKRLQNRIRGLLEEAGTRHKSLQLDQELIGAYQFEGMLGRSPLMLDVFAKIRRIAPHFRTVLVQGATGTGKELVANALHHLSATATSPFAVCNCAALVDSLLESELFGYVRGAFTGATQDKQGIFEYANGGTVFLDEIGELPLAAQAKLLRVLQNHEVQRVGSPMPRRVNVRVVAATHRDLKKMVAEKQFREDLYYRLSVVEIGLPQLAQRKEDLPLLQRHFVEKYAALYRKEITGITRRAQSLLSSYNWPGNIRELENVISGACIMTASNVIDSHDLPELRSPIEDTTVHEPELLSLEEMQNRYLLHVLHRVGGNKAKAAEILGIGRNTIYQMLSRVNTWPSSSKKTLFN